MIRKTEGEGKFSLVRRAIKQNFQQKQNKNLFSRCCCGEIFNPTLFWSHVCVCVCERERERGERGKVRKKERERQREKERETETEREQDRDRDGDREEEKE